MNTKFWNKPTGGLTIGVDEQKSELVSQKSNWETLERTLRGDNQI